MSFVEERFEQQIGADFQQREILSLDALVSVEDSASPLIKMLEYWLRLRRGQPGPPDADDFKISDLWDLMIHHNVVLIDCSAADPADYFPLLRPADILAETWLDGRPMAGRRLGQLESKQYCRALQSEYSMAKNWSNGGLLNYYHIKQVVYGIYRDYYRLLLPFAGPCGEVAMIAVVHRMLLKIRDPSMFPTWAKKGAAEK
ncbi:MAG: hypothetical protein OSB82_06915 [Alphaproteobacteria bacterium]|nr:hypothetical protein [Alphaproteobacteria bacterium]